MKNLKMVLLGLMLMFFSASMVGATTYTFSAGDLDDLEHGHYYTWGIDWSVPEGEAVVGASLFFDDIRNWDNRWNILNVHLLDTVSSGVTSAYDTKWGNEFFGQGLWLESYTFNTTERDVTYDFSSTDLSTLMAYAADGNFGFGFDPDCHFFNDGISFSIETAATPIPAPILLLGTGLIGMAGFRRKFRRDR